MIDGDGPHMLARQHPVVDLVRYGTRDEVRDVMVAGRLLVDDRRLTTIDAASLAEAAAEAAPRVAAVVLPRRYRPLAPTVTIE